MKVTDINQFKGDLKSQLQIWVENKIDGLFPAKPQIRGILKRGLNNYMYKIDDKIDKIVDNSLLFFGDEKGVLDTDTAFDTLIGMFKEMDINEYKLGMISVSVGKGEIVANIPHHPLLDMIVGELGKVTISAEDLLEIKSLL